MEKPPNTRHCDLHAEPSLENIRTLVGVDHQKENNNLRLVARAPARVGWRVNALYGYSFNLYR